MSDYAPLICRMNQPLTAPLKKAGKAKVPLLMVVSPAKTLDYTSDLPTDRHSKPRHLEQAAPLVDLLKAMTPGQIGALMDISDELAVLNAGRFQSWRTPFTRKNARPALFAFKGDVYEGLDAGTLDDTAHDYLERHLRILSGLYGILRPFDLIQPYRLEMGRPLANPQGKNLYAWWGNTQTDSINADKPAVLVNLASDEYFKSVKPKLLHCPVITPVFEDYKNGQYKIISFFAKRARGLMARYAAQNGVENPEQLKAFDLEGYAFIPDESDATRWVFRRRLAD
ncbi:UPF0246 protein [Silvimonas iriomotensis]|uniref:UPF0246 protein GCM10010970_35270 n=1 Tax=Silvimonas iriomotensis TaxID=449662 RepID=A0ABQ2PE30_9NEIS|nr:UPF0246 protein [Silvimonas iriomotensis]